MSDHPSSGTVAIVILTYNEEANIAHALSNVVDWADEVFVLDSMSTDGTVSLAQQYECHVAEHPFEDYSKQRNYALDTLPIRSEWVFFLDADERLSDQLKKEITSLVATSPIENGFHVKGRFIWMGRWIRHGYYPTWFLRLFRRGKGRCENRAVNEHLSVAGAAGYLVNDLIHEDRRGIGDWIAKHNRYASLEALELTRTEQERRSNELAPRLMGSQAERKRWIRRHVWNKLPPLVRPVAYFCFRYVLRLGFLDGIPGLTFHFLQALWYPILIDIKYLELRAIGRQLPEIPVTGTQNTNRHEPAR